jgi:hypothetical protein
MFANGTGYGLVHNEFHGFSTLENATKYCNVTTKRGDKCNLWSTGLAYTVDGGKNFQMIAEPPGHLVAALPYQYTKDQGTAGKPSMNYANLYVDTRYRLLQKVMGPSRPCCKAQMERSMG